MDEQIPTATRDEIEALKAAWREDPSWDIADTEGFEAHCDELAAYQREQEALWTQAREQRLRERAEALGIPGNLTLAAYIEGMGLKLAEVTRQLARLQKEPHA